MKWSAKRYFKKGQKEMLTWQVGTDKPGLLISQLISNMLTSTYGSSYFKVKITWIIKNKRKSEKPLRLIVSPGFS
jgi:hypothetical protein